MQLKCKSVHIPTLKEGLVRRRRRVGLVAGVCGTIVLLASSLAACGAPEVSAPPPDRAGVINVVGSTGPPQVRNFNPFLPTSALNELYGATDLIYEPLVQFDMAKPGTTYPWLARSWAWSDSNRVLTLQLRHGVTWSDGTPFTSADVAFTFNLIERDKALNTNGVTFGSVTTRGRYTVVLTFPAPAYNQFYYLASTFIVPRHIWASVANPQDYADTDPVGTGPFLLSSFSPQSMLLARNPHYWQPGEPRVKGIMYSQFSSTPTFVNALSAGAIDWAGGGFPDVQQLFTDKSPDNHYWFPPVGVNALVPNLTAWPLNITAVRKAISLSLDRTAICQEGEYGYEQPVRSPTGLLPSESSYLDPQYRSSQLTENLPEARRLLQQAGFHTNAQGSLVGPGNRPVTLNLIDPSGYVDYMSDDQVIAGDLARLGIKVNVSGLSTSTWISDYSSGHFQLTVMGSVSGPSPYFRYENWLDHDLSAPVGSSASGDYERWDNPGAQQTLAAYAAAPTSAARTAIIRKLEGYLVDDLPVIPLVGQASWGTYSTKKVTGWPSAADPYATPAPVGAETELVTLHLRTR
jgi:peptide/nickel transport system substrate-binding protein